SSPPCTDAGVSASMLPLTTAGSRNGALETQNSARRQQKCRSTGATTERSRKRCVQWKNASKAHTSATRGTNNPANPATCGTDSPGTSTKTPATAPSKPPPNTSASTNPPSPGAPTATGGSNAPPSTTPTASNNAATTSPRRNSPSPNNR